MKPKIAIAYQGGRQRAFAAGTLKALTEREIGQRFELAGIRGTVRRRDVRDTGPVRAMAAHVVALTLNQRLAE